MRSIDFKMSFIKPFHRSFCLDSTRVFNQMIQILFGHRSNNLNYFSSSQVWPNLFIAANVAGMAAILMTSPVFWLVLLLVPVTTLLPDIFFKTLLISVFTLFSKRSVFELCFYRTDVPIELNLIRFNRYYFAYLNSNWSNLVVNSFNFGLVESCT